ncbi:MAG: NHLP bacteriocin system secretion protein [Candidatus Sulfotelmatobacter sp.]
MNERIFRKASLDRLASPDQLDQIVRISTSKTWAALIALLILTAVVGVWAYKGSIPTTVIGRGMIVRSGGLLTVVSRGSGLVATLNVEVGEHVRANQVLATIAQPALIQKLRQITQTIADVQQRQRVELALKNDQSKIAIEAIERQRANTIREISELEQRVALAQQDIPVIDQLFAKGLVTKHQTILARQNLVDLQAQIAEKEAKLKQFDQQVDAARMEVRQSELDMQRELTTLKQNSQASDEELSRVQDVSAPVDGQVVELKVSSGGTVAEDAPVVTIQPDHSAALEVVAYVPAALAKDCRASMLVQISPSVAKREEFGYMEGHVTFVADYPATAAAIMRQFQNESLVSALGGGGPVSEVRASLDIDPSTFSGFRWSSSKGPGIRITTGTISDIHIVTRVQSPATLLMPWLKRGSGVE